MSFNLYFFEKDMPILVYAMNNYFRSEVGGRKTKFFPLSEVEDKKIIYGPLYHIAAIEHLAPVHIVRALTRFLDDNNEVEFKNKDILELLNYYKMLSSKQSKHKKQR